MPKRRGIIIQKQNKPKPKLKVERENLSNILSEGARKNKQEMEALLASHGGGFKTDFGLRGTIDFEESKNAQGWNRLFGYINGSVQNEQLDDAIEQQKTTNISQHLKKKLEPIIPQEPSTPQNLTELTKAFMDKMKKNKGKSKKPKKIKQFKIMKNFKQKKKTTRNRPNFVTPPPKLTNTLDIQYCDEPDTNFSKKRNLNHLKESISKLSTDFNQDRLFFQSMIKSANKRNNNQFFNQGNFKSIDAAGQNDETLPSIHASSNVKRFAVKSPVMASIRASRNLNNKNFMSAGRVDSPSRYSSDDNVSQTSRISKISTIRKSIMRNKRNKQMSTTMNKGTFFVHKREKSSKPAEKHQNVIRASTILNQSAIYSQNKMKRKADDVRKSKQGFSNRRTSKTLIEKSPFRNNLAANLGQSYIMNPCIESKEGSDFEGLEEIDMPQNVLVSQKTIAAKRGFSPKSDHKKYSKQNTDENKGRCATKAQTNDGGMGERGVLTTSPEEILSSNYCTSPAEQE